MGCMHRGDGARLSVVAIALDGSLPDSSRGGRRWSDGPAPFRSAPARVIPPPLPRLTPGYLGINAVSGRQSAVRGPLARTESQPPRGGEPRTAVTAADLEPRLVKESFARLMSEGPAAMEYFYARLFTANPDCRTLFPTSMTAQRERMFAALARLVWSLDNQPGCAEFLGQLGREHRRFGVTESHYRAVLRRPARHCRAFHRPELDG